MNIIKEKWNKKRILDMVFIGIILTITLWNLGQCNRIKIVDDEFGYWGIAALISGYDWTDLMAVTEYYSFGYSIILVPLLLMHKAGVAMPVIYKLALVINAIFMIMIYGLVRYVTKKIFYDCPISLMQAASLLVTLYIGYSSRTNSAWTETYLLLMFWCVVALIVRFVEKPNYINAFLLILATVNILSIHMRALGILISVLIVLAMYFIRNWEITDKKTVIVSIVSIIVLLTLFWGAKEYVTTYLYANPESTSVNDIPKQIERTKHIFSVTGMLDYIFSILGKIYYSAAATFLLVLVGFFYSVRQVLSSFIRLIKKRLINNELKQWIMWFSLLSFMGELGIACIFNCIKFFSSDTIKAIHMDSVVYGRYLDFSIGPMILFGIVAIYEVMNHRKEIILAGLLFLVGTFAVQYQIDVLMYYDDMGTKGFRQTASPWLFLLYQNSSNYSIYFATCVSLLVFLILLSGCIWGKKKCSMTAMVVVIAIFSGICGTVSASKFVESKVGKEKTVETIEKIVDATDETVPIYLVVQEKAASGDVKILQWMLGERTIHIILYDELQEVDMDQAVFLSESSEVKIKGILSDQMEYLYDSGSIALFASEKNMYYDILREKAREMAKVASPEVRKIDLLNVATELSYVKANGSLYYNYQKQEGYLTEGMNIHLEDGIYEFMIDLRVRDGRPESDVGYITVGDVDGNIQNTKMLHANDFENKNRQTINIRVKVENGKEPFVGVYTYGEAAFRIYGISYKKVIGNVEIDNEEIEPIIRKMKEECNADSIYYVDSDNSALTGFSECQTTTAYLSGEIIEYKEKFQDGYYIVENTEKKIIKIFDRKMKRLACEGLYILYEKECV